MVDYVEQDFYMKMVENKAYDNTSAPASSEEAINLDKRYPTGQGGANFNLVIASASGKRTGMDQGSFDYNTDASGANVDIYIAEWVQHHCLVKRGAFCWLRDKSSGININHVDFGGRATNFYDATETSFYDESTVDGKRGHGTQVADVAGGTKYGVAKSANILSVKIAREGANNIIGSNTVTAIKVITRRHNRRRGESGFRGSIINYSVDVPVPKKNKGSLGQSISAADAQNIIQVAAAGNSNDQAINHLPAAYTEVITVANMGSDYRLSPSSSFGTAVDIIAPGAGITAASADGNDGYEIMSGTSFSAPLVAGVCAQFMSYYDGPQTKAEVYNMLIDFSLKDIVDITGGGDTPNRLVNNGANTKGWPQRDELKV
jgi:subtilisin family serine protease